MHSSSSMPVPLQFDFDTMVGMLCWSNYSFDYVIIFYLVHPLIGFYHLLFDIYCHVTCFFHYINQHQVMLWLHVQHSPPWIYMEFKHHHVMGKNIFLKNFWACDITTCNFKSIPFFRLVSLISRNMRNTFVGMIFLMS